MDYWGKHIVIDARAGAIPAITSKDHIAKFVDELVVKIDMIKYGPLWIERFATHDPVKAGISFIQMIETSNITGHFCETDGDFYLDIFSCKDYDEDVVIDLVYEYFLPENHTSLILLRDAKKDF
jgi:S-adenosylmethionine/arginine decarboxylase-like enzyme